MKSLEGIFLTGPDFLFKLRGEISGETVLLAHILRRAAPYRLFVEVLARRAQGRQKVFLQILIFSYVFYFRALGSDKCLESPAANPGIMPQSIFDKFMEIG